MNTYELWQEILWGFNEMWSIHFKNYCIQNSINPEDIYRITQEHTSIMDDTIDPERVAEAIKQYIKD